MHYSWTSGLSDFLLFHLIWISEVIRDICKKNHIEHENVKVFNIGCAEKKGNLPIVDGDTFYKKNIIMNKYINKDIGKNVLSSYKRAFNIVGKSADNIDGSPDAVLFRQDEEKNLFEKIKEIRKNITIKENNKIYSISYYILAYI